MISETIIKEAKGFVDKHKELDIDKFFKLKELDPTLKGLFITNISEHQGYFIEESIIDKRLYVKKRKIPFSKKYPELWAIILVVGTAGLTLLSERLFLKKDTQEIRQELLRMDSTASLINDRVDSLINSPTYQLKNDSAWHK